MSIEDGGPSFVALIATSALAAAAVGAAFWPVPGLGSSASERTYSVSTAGKDSNPGTLDQPWRTIQHAADHAGPGDAVLIRGGTYSEKLTFSKSGAPGSTIRFEEHPAESVVVDGTLARVDRFDALVTFAGASHVELRGLEIRDSAGHGILVSGEPTHLVLAGLRVTNHSNSGIFVDGPRTEPAFSTIIDSEVDGNGLGGITLWRADSGYWLIDSNHVHDNRGTSNYDGIQVGGGSGASHHVVVRGNLVHDNGAGNSGADNIDVGGHAPSHHYLVEANDVRAPGGSLKVHAGSLIESTYGAPHHIVRRNRITGMGSVIYGFPDPVAVYHNTYFDCGQCVMFYTDRTTAAQSIGDDRYAGGDTGRANFKNNIFFQNARSSDYAILFAGPGSRRIAHGYDSVRFRSNLYRFDVGQKLNWPNGSGGAIYGPPIGPKEFAAYQAQNAPEWPDVGSVLTTAPAASTFTNAPEFDYTLVANSPAIDVGTPLTTAKNSGTASTSLVVDRASYFFDGYCLHGQCVGKPDSIRIAGSAPIAIVPGGVDDATNSITLSAVATWTVGAPVTLDYTGNAPDAGAFERP